MGIIFYLQISLKYITFNMTAKIKVLQVIPKLGYGGAETGCYDLAHYLYMKRTVNHTL